MALNGNSNGFTVIPNAGPVQEDFVEGTNSSEFMIKDVDQLVPVGCTDAATQGGEGGESEGDLEGGKGNNMIGEMSGLTNGEGLEDKAESNGFVSEFAAASSPDEVDVHSGDNKQTELSKPGSDGPPPDTSVRSADGFEIVQDPTAAVSSTSQEDTSSTLPVNGVLGTAPISNGDVVEGTMRAPVQRTFYFVRTPRPDLSDILSEISRESEKLEEKRKITQLLHTAITVKQSKRREVAELRRDHRSKATSISAELTNKFEEIKPMQERIRVIRDAGSEARSAGRGLQVNSVAELQQRINQIEHKRQHETISLQEEKKLLREMQALEKSRPEVEAHEARRSTVTDQQVHRDGLESQLKPLTAEIDALKLQREGQKKIADSYNVEVEALDVELEKLNKEKQAALVAQEKAFGRVRALRREKGNIEGDFWQYRADLEETQKLVFAKDIAALEKFCSDQVENFHTKWKDPTFRANYIKANERSTLRRFQTLDTRRPGVDEDPAELISAYNAKNEQSAGVKEKANGVAMSQKSELTSSKLAKPPSKEAKEADISKTMRADSAVSTEKSAKKPVVDEVVKADAPVVNTEEMEKARKETEEEQAALKEKRREEAFAKSKEAEERKKRTAEKTQARAVARAAKEAEEASKRREKERQRKERKRVATAAATAAQKTEGASGTSDTGGEEAPEETPAETTQATKDDGLTSRQRKRSNLQKRKAGFVTETGAQEMTIKKASGDWPMSLIYISGLVGVVLILALVMIAAYSPWTTSSA